MMKVAQKIDEQIEKMPAGVTASAVTATPVKSYVEVDESNYKLLGILDSMKDLNNILLNHY